MLYLGIPYVRFGTYCKIRRFAWGVPLQVGVKSLNEAKQVGGPPILTHIQCAMASFTGATIGDFDVMLDL